MLITYIRKNKTEKSKGVPIGCVVALDKNHIGWSLCNPKDKWNKKLGLEIAKGRASNNKNVYDFHETLRKSPGYKIGWLFPIYCERARLIALSYRYIQQKAEIYFKD